MLTIRYVGASVVTFGFAALPATQTLADETAGLTIPAKIPLSALPGHVDTSTLKANETVTLWAVDANGSPTKRIPVNLKVLPTAIVVTPVDRVPKGKYAVVFSSKSADKDHAMAMSSSSSSGRPILSDRTSLQVICDTMSC